MTQIKFYLVLLLMFPLAASAERIKRPPELGRARPDRHRSSDERWHLQIGDIIATGKGYVRFRGVKADGSYDFESDGNPWFQEKQPRQTPR